MGNFLKAASKQVTDVRSFLRETAGGNSIKYSAEKGAKHRVYIPFREQIVQDENGQQVKQKQLIAIQANVHEWMTADGKFKATCCIKDVIRKDDNGQVLNDGTCPFCDRVGDAWDIYNYRKELEEATCQLTGEERKKHLEKANKDFVDARKAKEVRPYIYILVAKMAMDDSGNNPKLGADKLPEYELKVMKLSASRVEKIEGQLANSGIELAGSELIFDYPATDDKRLMVSQSTTSPVFPNNMLTAQFPDLVNKINTDVSKFEWDGIEKAFPEWNGMSTSEAKTIMTDMFTKWDEYKAQKMINPNAKYMEYVTSTPSAVPSLDANVQAPVLPNLGGAPVPTIPVVAPTANVAPAPAPAPAVAPTVAPAPAPAVAPAVDPNGVFGAANGVTPTIQI